MKRTRDYDSTFQTLKNRHKRLLIAVINDCFHKNYPMNAAVELLPTKSQLMPTFPFMWPDMKLNSARKKITKKPLRTLNFSKKR